MNLISAYEYVPSVEGNDKLPPESRISLTIRRVTVRDMFAIQRIIQERLTSAGIDLLSVDVNSVDQIERFWDFVDPVIRNHTSSWKNLTLDGVQMADAGQIVDNCSFAQMTLMAEVAGEVMRLGKVGDRDQKNSTLESAPANSDSTTTVAPASLPASSESETVAGSL